ncbi:MAG TPA: ABC transporter ATP-binding protein, partial [Kofleriaceae bacterium]|nr:ABC transporter ATP-binding protein [Kofleriaceae bacterium]
MTNLASIRWPRRAEAVVSARGLSKVFAETVAVDGIDLDIARGECFGILGPNGAGKTTTVEMLEGLIEPTAGQLRLFGVSWSEDAAALRSRIGIQLQQSQFPESSTVEEVFRLFASFYPRGAAPGAMLDLVGLQGRRRARLAHLSGGERQRVALGVALAPAPDIVFLDEPTTALDPEVRRDLWQLILELKAGGRTIVLTTHYMEEAERLCDRVVILDQGRVIAAGRPADLMESAAATTF